ncbi:hypothetical protein QJ856_gp0460 [Tupanvirus deep ocean]|uniref:Uncharacterized protein n=2 Tax=Tupanvirus TaxID=2094720 RepID=A0AC62A980_9VIRU|nr:hypothetical protein QJ856_gp0460 [Tupanvirus deep ocean]QKU34284.1 hypothetical protein [Tupanvirus deep ocean]
MFQELSSMTTIFLMYFFIFVKNLLFSYNFFDMQFFASTLLVILLSIINFCPERLTNETRDIGKFLGHAMFISVCFSLISGLVLMIYNVIFYFGFVNTIISLNMVFMFLMSSMVQMCKEQINDKLSKSNIGNKILNLINYYYNTYVVSKKLGNKLGDFVKLIMMNYVWVYCKIVFNKFLKINNELSENSQSQIVKTKLDNKYSDAKKYFSEEVIQPFFIKSFQSALENNPFAVINGNDKDNQNHYKNTLSNQNINMSFLANTKFNENDNIDDLDDDLDMSNVPEVPKEQIEQAEKLEKEQENTKVLTAEEKRAALKKKMAEKRANRGGPNRNQKSMQNNMANLMNMPGMNEMMETMLKGDNLEKLMKQMPKDKVGMQMPTVDAEQMKQLIRAMNKKK